MSKYDEICGRYDKADNEQRMTFLAALAEIEILPVIGAAADSLRNAPEVEAGG